MIQNTPKKKYKDLSSIFSNTQSKCQKNGKQNSKISLNVTMSHFKTPCRITQILSESKIQEVSEILPEIEQVEHNQQNYFFPLSQNIFMKEFLNFLKARFIINQIIDEIQSDQLLDLKNQTHMEFMFLLTSRVKMYLHSASFLLNQSRLQQKFKQQIKEHFLQEKAEADKKQLQQYIEQCSLFRSKNMSKWKTYDFLIEEIRNKFINRISRKFSFNLKRDKQKFLDGYEGDKLDFSCEEQIFFTHAHYIQEILNSQKFTDEQNKIHRLRKVLQCYYKICSIDPKKMNQLIRNSQIQENEEKLNQIQKTQIMFKIEANRLINNCH